MMGLVESMGLLKRGVTEIISEKELELKLQSSAKSKIPLRIKLGIDPTAPDIHLGHSVVLRKLRQFQDLGHRVILIIGDFTARIGDPSGRSETRKVLTESEIKSNTQTYLDQIGKILDTKNKECFELRYNSEWLSPLTFQKVIELSHQFTVAQLLEREDFKKRYDSGKPVGLHEFFYPIMQGFDSVAIKADVELGGTDQKFNILVGRELQRAHGFESLQIAVLMPILEGTDGVQKMSKSLGNYIGIHESPDEMFGKVMSIPDHLMPKYFELLTTIPLDEMKKVIENPRTCKAKLGEMILESYYGKESALKAAENFERIFREKKPPENIPEFMVPVDLIQDDLVVVSKLLVSSGLAPSVREAKRLLIQGGVEIDGEPISGENMTTPVRDGMVIRAGKRRFIRLRIG